MEPPFCTLQINFRLGKKPYPQSGVFDRGIPVFERFFCKSAVQRKKNHEKKQFDQKKTPFLTRENRKIKLKNRSQTTQDVVFLHEKRIEFQCPAANCFLKLFFVRLAMILAPGTHILTPKQRKNGAKERRFLSFRSKNRYYV